MARARAGWLASELRHLQSAFDSKPDQPGVRGLALLDRILNAFERA